MRRNLTRALFLSLIVLSACVVMIAAKIEVLNYRAGTLLPKEYGADGRPIDGTWRIDGKAGVNDPNRALRDAVRSIGLAQYFLAPGLSILAVALLSLSRTRIQRICAACALGGGVVSIVLMVYRGYFSSLGW